jgi:hypothetical protein
VGQGTSVELKTRDLKAELLAKERQHFENVRKEKSKATGTLIDAAPLQLADAAAPTASKPDELATKPAKSAEPLAKEDAEDILAQFDDADDDDSSGCV